MGSNETAGGCRCRYLLNQWSWAICSIGYRLEWLFSTITRDLQHGTGSVWAARALSAMASHMVTTHCAPVSSESGAPKSCNTTPVYVLSDQCPSVPNTASQNHGVQIVRIGSTANMKFAIVGT